MIKLEMLKYFTAVAQHGSLSDAADVLGRTPSAVSMMLKQFEDHIGAPLFETARKSRLTPLGEMVFEEARREVRHFENTVSIIDGISRAEMGYLRLAVTPSIATAILPKVIHEFTAHHPKVQVDIRDMDSEAIAQELLWGRADIGIGSLPQFEGMARQELFSDAFGAVCRKDDPLALEWPQLTWDRIGKVNLIANGLCDQITDPSFVQLLNRSRLRVLNTTTLLGLVREGVGITILPRLAISGLLDDLAFLPLTDVTARRSVFMVSAPKNILMPPAKAFQDTINKMVRDESFLKIQEI